MKINKKIYKILNIILKFNINFIYVLYFFKHKIILH